MLPANNPVLVKEREQGARTFTTIEQAEAKIANWKLLQGQHTECLFYYRISSIRNR